MTYLFDTYRHICGRTISIHDTEPCLCETNGETMERASIALRSLRRLLRRAKARGHTPWLVINPGAPPYTVLFAGRFIRVCEDGSLTAAVTLHHTPEGERRADPHWRSGNLNRWHSLNMRHAAECRRNRMYPSARFALSLARQERLRD